jgi:hypothetical protein
VGLDLIYVRCAEPLIAAAQRDRAVAESLMHGGSGATETIDIGRSEDTLYRLLHGGTLSISDDHDHWAGLALVGDGWLHWGIDTGYGSPRFLLPPQVAMIARELAPLVDAVLVERYQDVIRDDARLHGYVLPNFARLRRFYGDAANAHEAVVVTPA